MSDNISDNLRIYLLNCCCYYWSRGSWWSTRCVSCWDRNWLSFLLHLTLHLRQQQKQCWCISSPDTCSVFTCLPNQTSDHTSCFSLRCVSVWLKPCCFVSAAVVVHPSWGRDPVRGAGGRAAGGERCIAEEMGWTVHKPVSGVFKCDAQLPSGAKVSTKKLEHLNSGWRQRVTVCVRLHQLKPPF